MLKLFKRYKYYVLFYSLYGIIVTCSKWVSLLWPTWWIYSIAIPDSIRRLWIPRRKATRSDWFYSQCALALSFINNNQTTFRSHKAVTQKNLQIF